jgi:RNA polymerase sigma-70 factor (ECF subfamily)
MGTGGGALDDAALVAQVRAGDLGAFGDLVTRHTASAHRTAVLLGAGDDADDVVQEAFVKAYHTITGLRGDASFRSWLLAIVANETRNLHRSRKRRDGLAVRAAAREGTGVGPDTPTESALADERRAALVRALRGLDERLREVMVFRFLLDLSEAETAQVLGCPTGTVKSRTSRGLAKLRATLGPAAPTGVPHG